MDLTSTQVALVRCFDYSAPSLAAAIDTVLEPFFLGNLEGKRVLLKPNLVSAKKGVLACTEGRFILAVGRWFRQHGARVCIGDSPAYGSGRSVLERLDLLDGLTESGIDVLAFKTPVATRLRSGLEVGLASEVTQCDLLVNLPRVKAHAQLQTTLAVKNFFGCILGLRKVMHHMRLGEGGDFQKMLVELLEVLPRSVTLVDGITAMHETGPVGGSAYPLGLLAGAINPVAVDTALLDIIGVERTGNPLWRVCSEYGFKGTDPEQLQFPLLCPDELRVEDFLVPQQLSPIRFSPVRFMRGNFTRVLHHLKERR
jgi:uncharacterized protein (DUF362 family)